VVWETGQFFLSFSGSCLVSSSLSEVWFVFRFWRSALWPTSHPTLVLGSPCVGLLEACHFALLPFFGARSEISQPALCCQHVMLVFNFLTSFEFGCSSLVQETSFVDCYLPCFRQRLFTHPLSAHLPFQSLLTESSHGDQLLALLPFSSAEACQPVYFPGVVY
jgi:hypothetical protein